MYDSGTWVIEKGVIRITRRYVEKRVPKGTTRIIISAGVVHIEDRAFSDCDSLTQINIPEGIKSIGRHLFSGCCNLRIVNIPDSYRWHIPRGIGVLTLQYTALRMPKAALAVVIPTGVTRIGQTTFHWCERLIQIKLPIGVRSIGAAAFFCCANLGQIEIPESVESIGDSAFSHCALKSIEVPSTVTRIGENAFQNCECLTRITLPDQFCDEHNKSRLGISETVECIKNSQISMLLREKKMVGTYEWNEKVGLYRLCMDRNFILNDLKKICTGVVDDVRIAIHSRVKNFGCDEVVMQLRRFIRRAILIISGLRSEKINLIHDVGYNMLSHVTIEDIKGLCIAKGINLDKRMAATESSVDANPPDQGKSKMQCV